MTSDITVRAKLARIEQTISYHELCLSKLTAQKEILESLLKEG